QVLGIESIGTQDNFFDLGGNSLVGLQVIGELRKLLEVELTQVALYEAPTVQALVRYLTPAQEPAAQQAQGQLLAERRMKLKEGRRSCNDIALIGMAGRFPGARTPAQLWKNLSAGVEAVSFYSEAELLEAGVSPDKFNNPRYVRAGYDVEGFDHFDALLFGY